MLGSRLPASMQYSVRNELSVFKPMDPQSYEDTRTH
jgi:hypothetical protein